MLRYAVDERTEMLWWYHTGNAFHRVCNMFAANIPLLKNKVDSIVSVQSLKT